MKTIVIFLQIYILSVSCSPNLNYSTNSLQSLLVDPNASETGRVGTTSGMMVLYPKDTYSVPNSVYSDTTVAKINGVEVEISEGENGEIVVHIPSGLDNGKITIELTNSEDSLTIDNVFHLNDSSIPLITADKSLSDLDIPNDLLPTSKRRGTIKPNSVPVMYQGQCPLSKDSIN